MLKEGFIICDNETKEQILKNQKDFKNYIFLTYDELKNKLTFTVDKKAIFKIMNYYNVSYFMAKEYINGVKLIENKEYNIPKLDSLVSIYNYLNQNGYIYKDKFFKNRLSIFPVTFINPDNNKDYLKLKEEVMKYTNVYEYTFAKNKNQPAVYEFDNILEESLFIFNKIIDLVNKGVSLNKIFIVNNDEYRYMFKRLARNYSVSVNFKSNENILSSNIVRDFFNECYQKETFKEVLETLNNSDPIYSKIVDTINNYGLVEYKPSVCINILKNVFKEIKYPAIRYVEAVNFISNKSILNDDEYVFYPGFNLGVVPKIYKEEAFLNDALLEILESNPSYIKNKIEKENTINFITFNKNVFITYKKLNGVKSIEPSLLIKELGLNIVRPSIELGYSKVEDDLRLTSYYDKLIKYNENNQLLNEYGIQDVLYKTYNHKFKGVDKSLIDDRYSEKKLNLSYSSMKLYYQCPFYFYAEKVLGLGEYETTLATRLGTYTHAVLERSYQDDFDFERVVDEQISINAEDAKDVFFFNQMKSFLANTISFNKEFESKSIFKNFDLEKNIKLDFKTFTFEGFIDKVMYHIDGDDAYAVIVDYKTGSDVATLDNIEYGINLQLPIYMLLLKNNELFKGKNLHIIGFYLQKVKIVLFNNKKDIANQIKENLKLQGYTVRDISLINMFDPDFEKSEYIKSLSLTKDGGFNRYAKLFKKEEQDKIINLSNDLIIKAGTNILNGEYKIEPKKIDGKNISCTYCKYKDICYMDYEDELDLPKKEFKEEE